MFKKDIFLLVTSIIWGFNFVAQSLAMNDIGPFLFSFLRFSVASITMGAIVLLFNKRIKYENGNYVKIGILCGICLFFASVSQQVGLVTTNPGKAAFIGTLYVIFVPVINIFRGKKPTMKLAISVLMALIGLFMLTYKGNAKGIEIGDAIILVSSFLYAIHILLLSEFASKVDPIKFNMVQFITVAIFSLIASFIFNEKMIVTNVKNVIPLIIYAGAISTSVAYTTQTIGQRDNDPTIASLIMSLESVFAAIASYFFLNEILTKRELFGSLLIFASIIFVQISVPFKKHKNRKKHRI